MTTRRVAWLVAVVVAVVPLRVLWGSRVELARAEAELDARRPYQAVLHYERAVRWYLPGNPFCGRAVDGLEELAQAAEAGGDPELALFAYRGLRGAAYATRSFYQPFPARIEAAEEHIASLMAADPQAVWPARSLEPAQRRQVILDGLREHDDPSTAWVVALEAGFVAWLGGAVALAWRMGRPGRRRRTTWILAGGVVVGYALWILGMWLA